MEQIACRLIRTVSCCVGGIRVGNSPGRIVFVRKRRKLQGKFQSIETFMFYLKLFLQIFDL